MLYINSSSQSSNILSHVVAENDGPHGGFACARSSHEKHLALFLALGALHVAHSQTFSCSSKTSPAALERVFVAALVLSSNQIALRKDGALLPKFCRAALSRIIFLMLFSALLTNTSVLLIVQLRTLCLVASLTTLSSLVPVHHMKGAGKKATTTGSSHQGTTCILGVY